MKQKTMPPDVEQACARDSACLCMLSLTRSGDTALLWSAADTALLWSAAPGNAVGQLGANEGEHLLARVREQMNHRFVMCKLDTQRLES